MTVRTICEGRSLKHANVSIQAEQQAPRPSALDDDLFAAEGVCNPYQAVLRTAQQHIESARICLT